MQTFLDVVMQPLPVTDPLRHKIVMVDGFYIAYPSVKAHRHLQGAKTEESVLLWAIDAITFEPLHWVILPQLEDAAGWMYFFREFTERGFDPTHIVHDGHYGIPLATERYMPDVIHQRCVVHFVRNSHKKIGISPKSPLARKLQSLIYQLPTIASEEERQSWLHAYDSYLEAYLQSEHAKIPQTGAFRALHKLLGNAHERGDLFTYLTYPDLPNNTNAIESHNRTLREALRRHRGMPLRQREALVSWLLLFKSTDNLAVIRAQYEARKSTLFDA